MNKTLQHRGRPLALAGTLALAMTTAGIAAQHFAGPVMGLEAGPDDALYAADVGAGIVEIRKGTATLFAELPGVTDVAAIGRGVVFAITSHGFGGSGKLYRVSRGSVREIADLGEFEATVNPDGGIIDSNPFEVVALGGNRVLVADAAANALLHVDQRGTIEVVSTFPNELVSTAHIKQAVGCPGSGHAFCALPAMLPAEPVPTSVAVGPDGAYYVGELKGFPAPTGESRVWRIEPGSRDVVCGVDPECQQVADDFTSIIDLRFGPDGTLYVVELDEQGWLAMNFGLGTGGTVNACDVTTWTCTEAATGLPMVTAVAVDRAGTVHAVVRALVPPAAQVIALP